MENLMFIMLDASLVAGRIVATVLLLPVIFLFISYFILAEMDIFFTFSKENRVKYIMEANGKKWTGKVIFSSTKYYIDPITYDIEEITPTTPTNFYKKWNFFGMYWVGIPPFRTIYTYQMVWQQWNLINKGSESNYNLVLRNEITPYLFVKRTEYGIFLKEAENIEGYALNIKFAIYLRATNARIPIFDVDNALGQIQSLVLGEAAIFTKTSKFATLYSSVTALSTTTLDEHDEFSKFICTLSTKINGEAGGGLREKFGFMIEGAKIVTVEIAGENQKAIIDATVKVAIAEQNKQAKIKEAQGDMEASDLATQAKKNRYEIFKNNPEATAIEIAEKTFEKSNLTTYVTGKDVTPNIPLK